MTPRIGSPLSIAEGRMEMQELILMTERTRQRTYSLKRSPHPGRPPKLTATISDCKFIGCLKLPYPTST
jgi:hypothetical protein